TSSDYGECRLDPAPREDPCQKSEDRLIFVNMKRLIFVMLGDEQMRMIHLSGPLSSFEDDSFCFFKSFRIMTSDLTPDDGLLWDHIGRRTALNHAHIGRRFSINPSIRYSRNYVCRDPYGAYPSLGLHSGMGRLAFDRHLVSIMRRRTDNDISNAAS